MLQGGDRVRDRDVRLCAYRVSPSAANVKRAATAPCAGASVVATDEATRLQAIDALLCIINERRAERGLSAVQASGLLGAAAVRHSGDMVARKFVGHTSANGDSFRARIRRTGYARKNHNALFGETLTWGTGMFATPSQLVSALMQSPAAPPHDPRSPLPRRRHRHGARRADGRRGGPRGDGHDGLRPALSSRARRARRRVRQRRLTHPCGADMTGLCDEVRRSCAQIAGQARWVQIDLDALGDVEPGPQPALDPLRHYLEGSEADVAMYMLVVDAVNFGSGWFPTLVKREGCSGYFTVAWSIADRFRRDGPWSAHELREMRTEEVADTLGQRLDPVDLDLGAVVEPGVLERLDDRQVGVGQLDVLADQADPHRRGRPPRPWRRPPPTGRGRSRTVDAQHVADDLCRGPRRAGSAAARRCCGRRRR